MGQLFNMVSMISSNMKNLKLSNIIIVIFFLIVPSLAMGKIDFNTVMSSLKDNMPAVIRLTMAVSYIVGFWLTVSGILDLKKFGQSHAGGASSQESGIGGSLLRLLCGITLIYYPSTIHVAVATLWGGDGSIQSYTASANDQFAYVKEGALKLIQTIGCVSFVRGFVILGNSTKPGAQHGAVGKGILHIIGGILAINIWPTIQVVENTLGIAIV